MNKVKKVLYGALASVMVFSLAACDMVEKTPEAKAKEVIAKVKDEKITRGDIDKELVGVYKMAEQQYGANYKENPQVIEILKQQQTGALDGLIQKSVLIQKGNELGLFKEDEIQKTVDEKFEETKKNIESQGSTYEDYLKQFEITDADFKEIIKDSAKMQVVKDYIEKDQEVTDDDIKAYYDENVNTYKKEAGNTVSHILVKEEQEAKDIIEKLKNGANFAELAIEKSTDNSAAQGGVLQENYDAANNQFVAEFNAGIEKIKDGGISPEPVKSEFGYHIIKMDVRKEATTLPLEEVKPIIKNTLIYQKKNAKFDETYKEWEKELDVKKYEDKL